MKRLRQSLHSPLLLSTALPAGEWVLQNIPLSDLARSIDYLNLMAYDFVGPSYAHVTTTGHHAQLYTQKADEACGATAVDYVISRGFPAHKVLLGIPTYGRSFGGANGVGQSFTGEGGKAEYEVNELPRPGMTEVYDPQTAAVYAVGNGEFVTYDDKRSVSQKATYARSKGLAGLFYWHLSADRPGQGSLVNAGFIALNQHPPETGIS